MNFSIISEANASATTAVDGGFNFMSLLPFVALLGIMYFFIIRPQNKRAKEHQEMVNGLKRGDQVVTAGGIIGNVSRITDGNEVVVELASGVDVRVVRSSITQVLQKTGSVVQLDTKRPTTSTTTTTSETKTTGSTSGTTKTSAKSKKPVRSVMKKTAGAKKTK